MRYFKRERATEYVCVRVRATYITVVAIVITLLLLLLLLPGRGPAC